MNFIKNLQTLLSLFQQTDNQKFKKIKINR